MWSPGATRMFATVADSTPSASRGTLTSIDSLTRRLEEERRGLVRIHAQVADRALHRVAAERALFAQRVQHAEDGHLRVDAEIASEPRPRIAPAEAVGAER